MGDVPFDLGPTAAPRSRSRVPEVLLGTLLVALFALAGAWFYSTSTNRVEYLALRQGVQRGEVIDEDDLTVYPIDTDAPISALGPGAIDQVVGKVALADLAAGTLVSRDQVSDRSRIPAGSGIVGLDLQFGEFPSFTLRAGDRVRVIAVGESAGGASEGPRVIADRVEIVEVVEGGGNDRFFSLVLETELAEQVLASAARGEVRLIEVSGG